LWPIDLDGWEGDASDPRWQFVRDEIDLARRRASLSPPAAGASKSRNGGRKQRPAAVSPTTGSPASSDPTPIVPTKIIAPAVAAIAILIAVAITKIAPTASEPVDSAPVLAFVEPIKERADEKIAAEIQVPPAPVERQALRDMAPVLGLADGAGAADEPPEPFDLVAELIDVGRIGDETTDPPSGAEPALEAADQTPPAVKAESIGAADSVFEEAAPGDAGADRASETALEPLPLPPAPPDTFAGVVMRDCVDCPDLVEIPAGAAKIAAAAAEEGAPSDAALRTVTIGEPFALARREITFKQWDACVVDGGCRSYRPDDEGWARGDAPVVNVSWQDANAYVAWLSEKTGRAFRLPSEAEWEYAAAAGGDVFAAGAITPMLANYEDGARTRPAAVGSFAHSAFGLYDMAGNVWEWVDGCARNDENGGCAMRILKGGAYNSSKWRLKPGHRILKEGRAREADNGFRVARDLP
jgi:formylglycine-generating enzyme required for sulfatase activity